MRWLSLHSKKDACHTSHAAAFTAFKTAWEAAKASPEPTPPAEDPVPPPTSSSVAALWDECKKNKAMAAVVAKIEKKVTDMSEDFDDDPCFRPEEGFKEAIYNAVGLTRQVDEAKQKMDDLVIKHEKEIRDLRCVIREQADSMRCLETMVKDQRYEIAHLRAENDQLRADLEAVQDENNALRKESTEMRTEVGSLKDEMAQLREQMAAMQKEFDAYKKAHPM